jgi:hypothetical protein
MYGSRPWYQASGQAKYSSDEDHYIQVSAYDQPPQSSAPYLIIPGTPSTASVGSPSTGSATSFDAQTTGHQYPSFSYTDFGPDQASQGYTTPQPSIPVVFEDLRSPSRRRRRAPARRSGSAAAADQREEFDFPQRQQYQVTQQGVSGEAEIMSRVSLFGRFHFTKLGSVSSWAIFTLVAVFVLCQVDSRRFRVFPTRTKEACISVSRVPVLDVPIDVISTQSY